MAASRELPESPAIQGANEQLAYTINTPTGRAPSSIVMTVYDITDGDNPSNVTSTVTAGSTSVTGDAITTKLVKLLTAGSTYRVDVRYTDANSNVWEPYFRIICK